MKADELMIGDWVRPVIPYVIHCKINSSERLCFLDEEEIDIEPIPITQEILEMNGFKGLQFFGELVYKGYLIQCDTRNIRIRCEEKSLIDIPCRYVHELQHALRLCGIDKEIKL